MKHLLGAWSEVEPALEENSVIVFLDYDGTLTPITERPEMAELSPDKRNFLLEMTQIQGLKIAIISGRSLMDVKEKICIPGILYAGNHGLELEDSQNFYIHPEALAWKKILHELAGILMNKLNLFAGIFVEDKIFTLSVHYRLLAPGKTGQAGTVLMDVLNSKSDFSKLILSEGKKVWEIRPPVSWNKGAVLLWLLEHSAPQGSSIPFPIYAGDDQADEDAFRVLRARGFGIKITRRPREFSDAVYYLYSPDELFEFLKKLADFKKGERKSHANSGTV